MKYRIREYHNNFSVEGLFTETKKHLFKKVRKHLFKKDETRQVWKPLNTWGSEWHIQSMGPLPPGADFKSLDEAKEFIDLLLKPEIFYYYP